MRTINKKEVAELLGITEATLATQMVRRPSSLPAWFKRPGAKKPIWFAATVDAFLQKCATDCGAMPDDINRPRKGF